MKNIKNNCYKGTRILFGNDKHVYLSVCSSHLIYDEGFNKIELPIINPKFAFEDKGFEISYEPLGSSSQICGGRFL